MTDSSKQQVEQLIIDDNDGSLRAVEASCTPAPPSNLTGEGLSGSEREDARLCVENPKPPIGDRWDAQWFARKCLELDDKLTEVVREANGWHESVANCLAAVGIDIHGDIDAAEREANKWGSKPSEVVKARYDDLTQLADAYHTIRESLGMDDDTDPQEVVKAVGRMKADSARLDWLQRRNDAMNSAYGTRYGWKVVLSHLVTRLLSGPGGDGHPGAIDVNDANPFIRDPERSAHPTLREAIDAARAAHQRKEGA